jgi:SWI/SNF-related matrix-associated actin-dependent regulator 1 of chromatin subfamily A
MKITFQDNIFQAIASFEEKDALKAAGFRWNPDKRRWWTDKAIVAVAFKDVSDEAAISEIERAEKAIEASSSAQALTAIEIPLPEGKTLFPYQKAGIEYAVQNRSVLIGDEMGLGKTVQAIAVINVEKPKTVLIVCPATLKINWQKECNRWLVDPYRIHVMRSGDAFPVIPEIVIMNYDIAAKYADEIRAVKWDLLICDEAHYMKNPKAARTKALLGEGKKVRPLGAEKRIFLTGTPITNRPVEIWPLVNYLFPAQFSNFFFFAKRYCNAVSSRYGWDFSGASNLDELQQTLRSAGMIRRMKAQVLTELPAKIRQVISLPSDSVSRLIKKENEHGDALEKRVKAIKAEAKRSKASGDKEAYAAAVGQLRQAYSVAFEEMAAIRRELAHAKIPFVIEHITDIVESNGKVVVMAHHREVVDALQNHFGLAAVKLYGGMSDVEKENSVTRFQNDQTCKIFVGSIRAAGVGITLTAAAKVVFAELDWTPANMMQAEDRCHRIGQTESVLVQHLVFDGSLDARMAEILVEKMAIIGAALDETDL